MSQSIDGTAIVPVSPKNISISQKIGDMLTDDEKMGGPDFPDMDKKGNVSVTQYNLVWFLKRFEIDLCYDEFSLRTYVFGLPGHVLLNDAAVDDIYVVLDWYGLRAPKQYLWSLLRSLSRNNRAHPVRKRLEELQADWDGTSRLLITPTSPQCV